MLSCILTGCGESIERFEKDNLEGAELKEFLKSNLSKKVYLDITESYLDAEISQNGLNEMIYSVVFIDSSEITDNQINLLHTKCSKKELARKFFEAAHDISGLGWETIASLYFINNILAIPDISVNRDLWSQHNTGMLKLDFLESGNGWGFINELEGGFRLKGFFSVDSVNNCEYFLTFIPDDTEKNSESGNVSNEETNNEANSPNIFTRIGKWIDGNDSKVLEQSKEKSNASSNSKGMLENSETNEEPEKELDFETYLHNTTFRLGNNGRVNFQRNGKVSITGGRADLLGSYEIYNNQAVITKLQAVYGNFDASNNNGSSGYVKLNSNGSLSMTLSDGNETQSYTLEPI